MVPFGDTEALVKGVKTVLADRERYSANALAYVREHLTIDHMVDGLMGAIEFAEQKSRRARSA